MQKAWAACNTVAVVFGYRTEGGRPIVLQIVRSGRGRKEGRNSCNALYSLPVVQHSTVPLVPLGTVYGKGVDVRAFSVRPGYGTALECKVDGCCETNRKR